MKKVLLVILAAAIIITMAACSTTPAETQEQGLTIENGILKVGMDLQYPPFETFDNNNEPIGISVDVARELAESMGLELEVVNTDFGTLITALETKRIDIVIASMSITDEREEKVDFSDPYFYFKIIGLMNKDYAKANSLSSESTPDELWAIPSTRYVGLAGQISTDIPQSHGFEVEQSVDKSAAITQITTGKSDMLIISAEVVMAANEAFPDTTEAFLSPLDVSPVGMAVAEGNKELLDIANEFIAAMDEPDGINDNLREKYDTEIAKLLGEDITLEFYINEY